MAALRKILDKAVQSRHYTNDMKVIVMPIDNWLTASQIADMLPDIRYSRTSELLKEFRELYDDRPDDDKPFRQIGRTFIHDPDVFLPLIEARETKTGPKSQTKE